MKHPKYQQSHDVPAMPTIPDQFYATGQPKHEPSRSASAPVPEPMDNNGVHPAYQRNIRPSSNRRTCVLFTPRGVASNETSGITAISRTNCVPLKVPCSTGTW